MKRRIMIQRKGKGKSTKFYAYDVIADWFVAQNRDLQSLLEDLKLRVIDYVLVDTVELIQIEKVMLMQVDDEDVRNEILNLQPAGDKGARSASACASRHNELARLFRNYLGVAIENNDMHYVSFDFNTTSDIKLFNELLPPALSCSVSVIDPAIAHVILKEGNDVARHIVIDVGIAAESGYPYLLKIILEAVVTLAKIYVQRTWESGCSTFRFFTVE